MTKIAIWPVPTEKGKVAYQGIAGEKQSQGSTVGEALDALTAQVADQDSLLVVVQSLRPDRFFGAAQQRRLGELMAAWHTAADAGSTLPPEDQKELDALIQAELNGAANRAAALADELGR